MFLKGIGVGVNVLCWHDGFPLDGGWYLQRQDTKALFSVPGDRELSAALLMQTSINLGLALQGKYLQAKGYTKRDHVEALERVFSITGTRFVTVASEDASGQWIRFDHFRGRVAADRLLLRGATLDGQLENFAILYEFADIS